MKTKNIIISIILFSTNLCSAQILRFVDKEPVRYFNDIRPIPAPKSMEYERFDYYATVQAPLPRIRQVNASRKRDALDVNSLDEVPASSWFLPRLGYQAIPPEELLNGIYEYGPPQPPISVIRVRHPEKNPRLFVQDSRGLFYLLKFDPPDFPGISTTTSFVVNRLFWSFGYHVPEDHLFFFKPNDIIIAAESELDSLMLQTILSRVAPPVNGEYRTSASRIIEGLPVGEAPEKGVREDDPNDWFPHEDRRSLRGLRVFCALTNMVDISADNLLDIYVGMENKGYIKHYIVDFDDAFGTHAARNDQLWAGFNHLFSLKEIIRNLVTAGFVIEDWETLEPMPWPSVGTFEGQIFQPEKWKETHPFTPIRRSQPTDDYWAAKIVSVLSREHLQILIDAAQYPSPSAATYIFYTLLKRQEKIVTYNFQRVSPLEFVNYKNSRLVLENQLKRFTANSALTIIYEYTCFDDQGQKLSYPLQFRAATDTIALPISDKVWTAARDYLVVGITAQQDRQATPAPARFHLIRRKNGEVRLVGVEH